MVQSVARALQEAGETNPAKFLNDLNRTIYKNIERTKTDKHSTLAFLDYDGERIDALRPTRGSDCRETRWRGGADRNRRPRASCRARSVNISEFVDTKDVTFGSGDIIVLHTDGVTEAENRQGELYGIERLCESARDLYGGSAQDVMNGILERSHDLYWVAKDLR